MGTRSPSWTTRTTRRPRTKRTTRKQGTTRTTRTSRTKWTTRTSWSPSSSTTTTTTSTTTSMPTSLLSTEETLNDGINTRVWDGFLHLSRSTVTMEFVQKFFITVCIERTIFVNLQYYILLSKW